MNCFKERDLYQVPNSEVHVVYLVGNLKVTRVTNECAIP